jgi:FkbM family methyltransferase
MHPLRRRSALLDRLKAASVVQAIPLVVEKTRAAGGLCRRYVRDVPFLGMGASSKVFLAEASARRPLSRVVQPFAPALVTIRPAGYRFPLTFRRLGTDSTVVRQMLVREEYRPIASLSGINLIVDCGANIGAAAYYLLHRYPSAQLIAVEPDAENVALCRRNLALFGTRAKVIRAAVWSECRPLRIVPESRVLGSWALRVEPAARGDVEGLTMPEILERAGVKPPIDILKIDIEGAETEVFRGQCRDWLDFTRHIAIELHGPAPQVAFDDALGPFLCERHQSHELTIANNLRRADSE